MSEEDEVPDYDRFFEVTKVAAETVARTIRAIGPQQAAEQIATDAGADELTWVLHSDAIRARRTEALPVTYVVRDMRTGVVWMVDVGIVVEPRFVGTGLREVPMPPATHVVWGSDALCADLRLADLDAWPEDQQRVTLRDVYDGAKPPTDACATCWTKAPSFVDRLMQIGRPR